MRFKVLAAVAACLCLGLACGQDSFEVPFDKVASGEEIFSGTDAGENFYRRS